MLCYYIISRVYLHFGFSGKHRLRNTDKKSFAVIGAKSEIERIKELLAQTQDNLGEIIDFESIESFKKSQEQVDEIIFC